MLKKRKKSRFPNNRAHWRRASSKSGISKQCEITMQNLERRDFCCHFCLCLILSSHLFVVSRKFPSLKNASPRVPAHSGPLIDLSGLGMSTALCFQLCQSSRQHLPLHLLEKPPAQVLWQILFTSKDSVQFRRVEWYKQLKKKKDLKLNSMGSKMIYKSGSHGTLK